MPASPPDNLAPVQKGFLQWEFGEYPRQVRIESSSMCNMKCMMCAGHGDTNPATEKGYILGMSRTKARMPTPLFTHIIEDIASWKQPLYEIVPTNYGEWFMHPEWWTQAQAIDRLLPKTKLVLPTTGVLVTDAVLMKLADLKTLFWLNVSVNAFFADTYERIHNQPASHIPRIRRWVEKFKDMRPDVHLQFSMVYDPIRQGQSEKEKELFQQYWSKRLDGTYLGEVTINQMTHVMHGPGAKAMVTLPCRSMFDGLVIFDDGRVGTGCCFDADAELVVGKVPGTKLLDIWRGEKLRAYGRLHNEGRRNEIGICSGCSFA